MSGVRQEKINEQVKTELMEILRTVKDPRVSKAFISIMEADVSKDLSFAKVYYSVMNGNADDVKKGLNSASGFIRSSLAKRLNFRTTPKLSFIEDHSTEKAFRISEILKSTDEQGKE